MATRSGALIPARSRRPAFHRRHPEQHEHDASRDREHRRDDAEPDQREPRPNRQAQVERRLVAGIGARDPVEQHPGEQDGEQQEHQRRDDIEPEARPRRQQLGYEVDLDVRAAVADAGEAPQHGDAEHQPRDVERVRDRRGKGIAAERRGEHQHGDHGEEQAGDALDRAREPVEPPHDPHDPVTG
jgi:hypothetical protein